MISEKNILQSDFERKKACKEIPGKNNDPAPKKILLMTYNAEKKNLTYIYVGEKNFKLRESHEWVHFNK